MYRSMRGSLFGLGAVGPTGYGQQIRCLYHPDGTPVRTVYARDPLRYGEGGPSGSRVCYRTTSAAQAPTIPFGPSRSQCLSIYDLYGDRVCFTPIGTQAPAITSTYTPALACSSEDIASFVKRMAAFNATAGASIKTWSGSLACQVMKMVWYGSDTLIEVIHNKPCQAEAGSAYALAVARLGEACKAGGSPANLNVNTTSEVVSRLVPAMSMFGASSVTQLTAFVSEYVSQMLSRSGAYQLQMQNFLIEEASIIAACGASTTAKAPEAESKLVSSSIPADVVNSGSIDETQSNSVFTQGEQDSGSNLVTEESAPESKAAISPKALAIGGILVVVAVTGVAVVMSKKKK